MARYIEAVCRKCRREGEKLYLKGDKCFSAKCTLEKRDFAPGMGRGTRNIRAAKVSEYGQQLRAKQKVRRYYGILERQFRKYFADAVRRKGVTGEILLSLLERRLDNVVYRLGFASSRSQARQLVRHGHVRVNGKNVNIPSFSVKVGNVVALRSAELDYVKKAVETAKKRDKVAWLDVDYDKKSGRVVALPARENIDFPAQEKLIVELYSK